MVASIPRSPMVSVVMAVKNGGQVMREAINSILNQTFTDFEFIIINDGSTDETLEVLAEYSDPRIQVYSQENRGVAITANRGVCLATGKYIARQDHDDISLPTRLEKQVAYLEENPHVGLLGTAAEIWNQTGPTGLYHDHPTDPKILKFELIFNNPFVHTSITFRRDLIKDVGFYNPSPSITPLDDYDFISRVSKRYPVANLKERLVIYREVTNSLTSGVRQGYDQILNGKLINITASNLEHYASTLSKKKAGILASLYHSLIRSHVSICNIRLFISEIEEISRSILSIDGIQSKDHLILSKIEHIKYRAFVNPGSANSTFRFLRPGYLTVKEFFYFLKLKLYEMLYSLKVSSRKILSKFKKMIIS